MSLVELWLRAGGQEISGVVCLGCGWESSLCQGQPMTQDTMVTAATCSHWPCSQGTCCSCQNQLQTVPLSSFPSASWFSPDSISFHSIRLVTTLLEIEEVLAYSSVGKIGEGLDRSLNHVSLLSLSFSGLCGYVSERKSLDCK